MKNISLIIESEANSYINKYMRLGQSRKYAIRSSLDEIKEKIKRDPLIAKFWEVEKALIIKKVEEDAKN